MVKFSDFRGLVTLTLDRVILHTVMHHSLTSTYTSNVIEIEETFSGQTDRHLRPTLLGRLGGDNLINELCNDFHCIIDTGCTRKVTKII